MLTSDHTALPSETLHSPCRPVMPLHQPAHVRGGSCDYACFIPIRLLPSAYLPG